MKNKRPDHICDEIWKAAGRLSIQIQNDIDQNLLKKYQRKWVFLQQIALHIGLIGKKPKLT